MTDPAATAEPHDAGEGRRWVVILRELPSEVPGEVRLRHFLKRALRDWGLRCESVQSATLAEELEWNRGERVRLQNEVDRFRERLARASKPRKRKAIA
ncbi:MAG TPA: hypothetical protein VGI99_12060 [Gemmataceae bacterium]